MLQIPVANPLYTQDSRSSATCGSKIRDRSFADGFEHLRLQNEIEQGLYVFDFPPDSNTLEEKPYENCRKNNMLFSLTWRSESRISRGVSVDFTRRGEMTILYRYGDAWLFGSIS